MIWRKIYLVDIDGILDLLKKKNCCRNNMWNIKVIMIMLDMVHAWYDSDTCSDAWTCSTLVGLSRNKFFLQCCSCHLYFIIIGWPYYLILWVYGSNSIGNLMWGCFITILCMCTFFFEWELFLIKKGNSIVIVSQFLDMIDGKRWERGVVLRLVCMGQDG